MWVAYAPLSEETAAFYCDGKEDCSVLFWTSQIFQAGGVLFGIAGMYVTDKYGVKVSVSTLLLFLCCFRLCVGLLSTSLGPCSESCLHYLQFQWPPESLFFISDRRLLLLLRRFFLFYLPKWQNSGFQKIKGLWLMLSVLSVSILPPLQPVHLHSITTWYFSQSSRCLYRCFDSRFCCWNCFG